MIALGALVALVELVALSGGIARAADDDFTDIDLGDAPKPKPSGRVAPPGPKPPKPGRPSARTRRPDRRAATGPATGAARDLIQRYEQGRHQAFADRMLTLTVCGRNLWGGDSRCAHAFVKDGDDWLERGDEIWRRALRAGDRKGMQQALRDLIAASEDYHDARNPPALDYQSDDSPNPHPFPSAYPSEEHPGTPGMGRRIVEESEQWRPHDQPPLEEPSKFEKDPHW